MTSLCILIAVMILDISLGAMYITSELHDICKELKRIRGKE